MNNKKQDNYDDEHSKDVIVNSCKIKKPQKAIISYQPLSLVLYISLFILLPYFMFWAFGTADFKNQQLSMQNNLIAIYVYAIIIFGLNIGFYFAKVLALKSFNYNIPLTLLFLWMITSAYFHTISIWVRIAILIPILIVFTLLTNFVIGKIEDYLEEKEDQKNKSSLKKLK